MWILEIWENISKENWYLCWCNWVAPQHLVPCAAFRCCWLPCLGFSWPHWELRHLAHLETPRVCCVFWNPGAVLQWSGWPLAAFPGTHLPPAGAVPHLPNQPEHLSCLTASQVAHGAACWQLKWAHGAPINCFQTGTPSSAALEI